MSKKVSFAASILVIVLSVAVTGLAPVFEQLMAQPGVVVESADPPTGEQDTPSLDVTISGKGFKEGSTASFLVTGSPNPGGIIVNSTRYVNARTLISNVTIQPEAVLGGFDIEVLSNGRRGKGIDLFKVVEKNNQQDSTPPDAAADFQVLSYDHSSAQVSWIASGDDGMTGTASSYDIRYLPDVAITESNWASALPGIACVEPVPTPEAPGTLQTFVFSCTIEAQRYYSFGIRVLDEVGNGSPLAVTGVTTSPLPVTGWTVEMIDAGRLGSLAVDPDGNPGIAYNANDKLAFAHWNGQSWDLEMADGSTRRLGSIDLGFTPTGEAAISYDANHRRLNYARKIGSFWDLESVNQISLVSNRTALAFDAQGEPRIAYESGPRNNALTLERFNGSGWDSEIVAQGISSSFIDMALDANGNPAIVYSAQNSLRLAMYDGALWSVEAFGLAPDQGYGAFAGIAYNATVDDFVLTDMVVDAFGQDTVGVRFLQRNGQGQWIEELLAIDRYGLQWSWYPSLGVDGAGVPRLVIHDVLGNVYLASRTGDVLDPWLVELVSGLAGDEGQLKIGLTPTGEKAYIAFNYDGKIWLASKLLSPAP